ncbi:MAG: hypothetical protein J7L23_02775 [Candidatus Diapherotrites archaeon]|nr:hypothetical protein [Candidatus Diapherotrites archaeon]
MLFNQTQKKRLQIIMDMDDHLKELEPLFYSEFGEGETAQLIKVKDELQKLANLVMKDAINGKTRKRELRRVKIETA